MKGLVAARSSTTSHPRYRAVTMTPSIVSGVHTKYSPRVKLLDTRPLPCAALAEDRSVTGAGRFAARDRAPSAPSVGEVVDSERQHHDTSCRSQS